MADDGGDPPTRISTCTNISTRNKAWCTSFVFKYLVRLGSVQGAEVLAEGEPTICLSDVTVTLATELSEDVGVLVFSPQ